MPLTRRLVRTFLVEASPAEDVLSKRLSLYFHREHLAAFPKVQEHRIRLTYWKMLASSPSTLGASFERLIARLENISRNGYAGRIVFSPKGKPGKTALREFTRGGKIFLVTDSAGAGLDLSHCALVVNYDLPWNAQKLEQRISRCHRYGQKHDVRILNFLDPGNRADRRLYDSLNKKLRVFDAVFGASETILGMVADVRSSDAATPESILAAIPPPDPQVVVERMVGAEADLLAHFDEAVRERFRRYADEIPSKLSRLEFWLWEITRHRLANRAEFNQEKRSFVLEKSPWRDLRLSRVTFGMERSLPRGERYHLGYPLARRDAARRYVPGSPQSETGRLPRSRAGSNASPASMT